MEEWAQRYICTKYKDKDITSCNAYCDNNLRDEYYLDDVLMCDDYNLIANMCTIILRTNVDIEGLTKRDLDYYISVQIVYAEDKETGGLHYAASWIKMKHWKQRKTYTTI